MPLLFGLIGAEVNVEYMETKLIGIPPLFLGIH